MTRVSVIVGAFVVALGLATPTGRASAQNQAFACANLNSGAIKIVAPNATCGSNEQRVVLGGALAGAHYECVHASVVVDPGAAYTFTPSSPGASFGSAISTTGATFNSILLQQGIYQIHLSGYGFFLQQPNELGFIIEPLLNNNPAIIPSWVLQLQGVGGGGQIFNIVGGDRLFSVGSNNSSLQFFHIPPPQSQASVISGSCELVITKLQ